MYTCLRIYKYKTSMFTVYVICSNYTKQQQFWPLTTNSKMLVCSCISYNWIECRNILLYRRQDTFICYRNYLTIISHTIIWESISSTIDWSLRRHILISCTIEKVTRCKKSDSKYENNLLGSSSGTWITRLLKQQHYQSLTLKILTTCLK